MSSGRNSGRDENVVVYFFEMGEWRYKENI